MHKYNFLKESNNIIHSINLIEDLKEYFFTLLNNGDMSSKTYLRLSAGADYLMMDLRNVQRDVKKADVCITLENLNLIQKNSQKIKVDLFNIKVNKYLQLISNAFTRYLRIALKREDKGINEKDVDNLLKVVELIDESIDNNQ